jgi:hypothetical protein
VHLGGLGWLAVTRTVPVPAPEPPRPVTVELIELPAPVEPTAAPAPREVKRQRRAPGAAKADATRASASPLPVSPLPEDPAKAGGAPARSDESSAAHEPALSPAQSDAMSGEAEPPQPPDSTGAADALALSPDPSDAMSAQAGLARPPDPTSALGPKLFPSIPGVAGVGNVPALGDTGTGRTIRNDPSELPDPAAVAAYNAERARARVGGWISDDLAEIRVANGAVDGYFQDVRRKLEQAAAKPPAFNTQPITEQLVSQYTTSARNYGATGSPFAGAPDTARKDEVALDEQARTDLSRGALQKTTAQQLRTFGRAGQSLRDFADGKMTNGLLALVELRQARDGKLLGHLLVESSGSPVFDAHVMKSAPAALAELAPPPATGAGLHEDGMRSLWAFEGKVTYTKKIQDVKLDESWWYHAATLPLGLLTGGFDETTGDVYVVDLTDPQYSCKVRLLRVY